ncbi:exonuclease domain-containing protein [Levilactobacillus tongjiangensis]|uniref:Exonuclease domain-containing protein n=1 Tax=Levilactobacillus tongjiangensis TaxID=2486023 RepID=A0ABW1SSL0_9LACO|nr:exonuclease domain-containing protein [Levilactobacillus tongjiangensis]
MIVAKTYKDDFDRTVTLVDSKKKSQFNLDQLTSGEIVALWWSAKYRTTAYIPKYFKQIYAIDIPWQRKIFEKFGYLETSDDRYNLTEKGQNLLDSYNWIVQEHIDNTGIFNSGRRLLSQKDISNALSIGSGFNIPDNGILPNDFISLDIETTGLESSDNIIQLSATHVLNGIEVNYFDTYVHGSNNISTFIKSLTNITEADLANAPTLEQVKSEFTKFVGKLPIVGWNIKRFDIPFLSSRGINFFDNDIIDLLYVVRRYNHGGINNTLTTVKRMLGVKSLAHNSLADARATVLVGKLISNFKQVVPSKKISSSKYSSSEVFEYDDDSPIFDGLRFIFTGSIEDGSYNRKQMEYIVKKHGGIVTGSLSKNVNYFIQGIQVSANLTDGEHSSKELKFQELQKNGVDIYKTDGRGFEKLLASYKCTALL